MKRSERILSILVVIFIGVGNAESKILTREWFPIDPGSMTKRSDPETEMHRNHYVTTGSCEERPKISITSNESDKMIQASNVTKDGLLEQTWYTTSVITIKIQCEARTPIQWIFEAPHEPNVIAIDVERDFGISRVNPNWEKPETCFRTVMTVRTSKLSTGLYRCERILELNDPRNTPSIFLYADVNKPPILLYTNMEFYVIPNETSRTVVLPCQGVNPNLDISLYKGNQMDRDLGASFPYNPRVGFTLDLEKLQKPFDNYKCKGAGGSVNVNVLPFSDFRASPTSRYLSVAQGKEVRLTCEAVFPIRLSGFIDESKMTSIKEENGPIYKHKIIYDYVADFPTKVSCVNRLTNTEVYSWNITVKKAQDPPTGISYDSEKGRFYCHSIIDAPPISLVQCNNAMECQLADNCFSWKVPYKISNAGTNKCFSKNIGGTKCREEDKRRLNSTSHCYYIDAVYPAGTVHCQLPENGEEIKLRYFKGLSSGRDIIITDWNHVPIKELIDIKLVGKNRTSFYTGELIEVECRVPKFIFAQGQTFRFKLEDGSFILPEETIERVEDDGSYLVSKKSKLKLVDPQIREVVCISPLWNETGWRKNSLPISVAVSISPNILPLEESPFLYNGESRAFACKAEGHPSPTVAWYRNGTLVEEQEEQEAGKLRFAILLIKRANIDDEGEFVCTAANVKGTDRMSLNLVVTQNKKTIYIALLLGIVTVTIFMGILMLLWGKLRRNQAIVRRLTEQEVKEFREGDPSALRNIPNGYVQAQYLPYDKGYEILQEDLKIDEEVLGEGEYGVVLKGTLRRNNTLKEVAVKTSRSTDVNHFKALLTELKMLTYIGYNENVIALHGAVTRNLRDRDVCVVIEYCKHGDLESYLCQNRDSFLNQIVNEKIDLNLAFNFDSQRAYQTMKYNMRTADLISWSYQIASGMEYLANKKVIHGDLAARNILLTDDGTVKIIDFGLSKHLYNGSNYISLSGRSLPWKNSAPEVLQFTSFSTQSDVWAMGVTLWEIFSLGRTPYTEITWSWDFKNQLLRGYRLAKPSHANQNIYNTILKCWKNTPAERISFEELRKYFHKLLHHWAEEEEPSDDSDEVSATRPLTFTTPLNSGNVYVACPNNLQQSVHYTATV